MFVTNFIFIDLIEEVPLCFEDFFKENWNPKLKKKSLKINQIYLCSTKGTMIMLCISTCNLLQPTDAPDHFINGNQIFEVLIEWI